MAVFEIDRQTLNDLDLFNENGEGVSIFSLFNRVKTIGGKKKLKEMMETPSFDLAVLTSRRDSIKFFQGRSFSFGVNKNDVDFIEHYLTFNLEPLKPNVFDAIINGLRYQLSPNRDFYVLTQGISTTIKLIKILSALQDELLTKGEVPPAIDMIRLYLANFFAKNEVKKLLLLPKDEVNGYMAISHYDNLFRRVEPLTLTDLLNIVYELDAYMAVAAAAEVNSFCFPEYESSVLPQVNISGLYHPGIKNAVGNNVCITHSNNVCFLTGANMAGKSSYLKALGLAMYLAHVGFPVPANSMQTTIFKGLITTINLADNMANGYSHYYSEVKRLKKVAEKITGQDNLFVIFDELFRGTNVKDAHDASLATIVALAKIKHSIFLISTHIVEIANQLKLIDNITFKYFDATIENGKPTFDYQLKDGVSSETLGYFIFEREGIIEILNNGVKKI